MGWRGAAKDLVLLGLDAITARLRGTATPDTEPESERQRWQDVDKLRASAPEEAPERDTTLKALIDVRTAEERAVREAKAQINREHARTLLMWADSLEVRRNIEPAWMAETLRSIAAAWSPPGSQPSATPHQGA